MPPDDETAQPLEARFGEVLRAERERTTHLIASLERSFTSIVEATELTSTDDEHDPEGSTIAFERSQTNALRESATAHLAAIDAAIAKLAEGTYGSCERCGGAISPERLEARPAATTCITCASR